MSKGRLKEGKMIFVYVLEGTNKRYVGITNDLKRRLLEHKSKHTKGSQNIGAFKLIHTEEFDSYIDARKRETYLKSGAGREYLRKLYPRQGPPPSDKVQISLGCEKVLALCKDFFYCAKYIRNNFYKRFPSNSKHTIYRSGMKKSLKLRKLFFEVK
jgi:putative endonuclease